MCHQFTVRTLLIQRREALVHGVKKRRPVLDRLNQIVFGSCTQSTSHIFKIGFTGNDNDRNGGKSATNTLYDLMTIHTRHAEIAKHNVRMKHGHRSQPGSSVFGFKDKITVSLQLGNQS